MNGRSTAAIVVAVVLVVALVATGVLAVGRSSQLRRAELRQEKLQEQLADARARIRELTPGSGSAATDTREQPSEGPDGLSAPNGRSGPDGLSGLDELLGEDGLGQLGELFGELFGDDPLGGGGLGGLGGAVEMAACVQENMPIDVDDSSGEAQFDDIEDAVADLRDLAFTDPVEPTHLTPAEIAKRMTVSIREEYSPEEADIDRRYLAALGAIEPDLDLLQTQQDLLGEQVAGFYDSDTGEMVVGTADPDAVLSPTDQVTLAHELTHALTDQAIGLPEVLDDEVPDTDAALAALALVEGDATMVMQRFAVSALDVREQLRVAMDPRAAGATAQLRTYPYVLQQQLIFPYEQGLRFACGLEGSGGWQAVDAAYGSPPRSSAQILFPERYGEPPTQPLPALTPPGPGWTKARTDTLGAAELKWLFEAPGDDPQAALENSLQRVSRWDGGTAALWVNGEATSLGVRLRDRGGNGPSLCTSVTAWYDAAFDGDREVEAVGDERLATAGRPQAGVVACTADEVVLATAPDVDMAGAIAGTR